jgi:hypothetical protein
MKKVISANSEALRKKQEAEAQLVLAEAKILRETQKRFEAKFQETLRNIRLVRSERNEE